MFTFFLATALSSIHWLPMSMFGCIAISAIAANAFKNATSEELAFVKDDQTLLVFRILMPATVILALVISPFDPWTLTIQHKAWDVVSICLFTTGMLIRWIAIVSLKRAFTVKVSILKNHELKTDGIYTWVRHPSYTGMYIYGLGYGMALQSPISLLLVMVGVWVSTRLRIPLEEAVLTSHFGESYKKYQSRTWRLFPGLY